MRTVSKLNLVLSDSLYGECNTQVEMYRVFRSTFNRKERSRLPIAFLFHLITRAAMLSKN